MPDNPYRIDTSENYDFDTAIRNRFNTLAELGSSANTIASQVASRQQARRAADEATAFANAQNAGAQRNQRMTTGLSGGATKGNANFGQFMQSISAQESGGSYGARNSLSGAMGKYQIMPSNIAGSGRGWDYEALGRDVSSAQFMASPEIQEQIASYKLKQYYNSYGPAGAAIAWYAGPGAAKKYIQGGGASTHGEAGGHPSVSGYMQSILRRMGLG